MRINALVVARGLFLVNAVIWLTLGVYTMVGMANRGYSSAMTLTIIAALMVANAGFMLIIGSLLAPGRKWIYFLGLALLSVNILLSFTDEFGAYDLITLLIDVILLVLLVLTRKTYLSVHT